ncbi:MAG: site-specific integrase [Lachnospiraceae bacterium]|nr:site-specific integrase [Lachnospiraceae bacterium]
MGYIKLSENRYKIIIELGNDVSGKRRRKTEIFEGSPIEVKIREAELIKEYYRNSHIASIKELTFEQYSEIFIKRYCHENLGLITIDGYERRIKTIIPILGKTKLYKITPYMLDCMYQELREVKKLGYHSMYEYYKIINVMLNQAIKWELIDKNPNLKVIKPKKRKSQRNFYDLEQVKIFLNCLANERIKYKALFILAIDSGARRSEICALRWSDIDFNYNTLKINNSLKVVNGVLDEETAKTQTSTREIIISDATINVLKEYKEWQDNYKEGMSDKWIGTDRIFISKHGDYMHPDTCNMIFRKIIKKYNLPYITFHELRHTSASILINKGINPKTVSQRLGHASTDVTMEIYSHVFDNTKRESAIVFDEIMSN